MKRQVFRQASLIAASVCLLLLASCASSGTDTASSGSVPQTASMPAETAAVQSEPQMMTDAQVFSKAEIRVQDAETDSWPGEYDSFTALSGEYERRIIFSTDETVRDFKVLSLSDGTADDFGKMHFSVKTLYTQPLLTPDRPLVVTTVFYGLIPNNGISYVDETGKTRLFAVDMSGEDGSLTLWEFE